MSVRVCAHVCRRHGISPELELQVVVSHLMWSILLEEQYVLLNPEPSHPPGIVLILN